MTIIKHYIDYRLAYDLAMNCIIKGFVRFF